MMNEARGIAKLCYKHCDEAVGIIEFLEAGNTPEVEANYCGGADVANLIRKAMEQRLVMSIMRMHDGAGRDRETLLKAFSLLSDHAVRREVSKHGGDKARLDAAIAQWPALKDDPIKEKMRAVRDYESAHNIPSKAGVRPNMLEFIRFSRETIKLVEDLAAGTGIVLGSFDGAQQIWAKRATAYWDCLKRKESVA
jgi:hypothetical protein